MSHFSRVLSITLFELALLIADHNLFAHASSMQNRKTKKQN